MTMNGVFPANRSQEFICTFLDLTSNNDNIPTTSFSLVSFNEVAVN